MPKLPPGDVWLSRGIACMLDRAFLLGWCGGNEHLEEPRHVKSRTQVLLALPLVYCDWECRWLFHLAECACDPFPLICLSLKTRRLGIHGNGE